MNYQNTQSCCNNGPLGGNSSYCGCGNQYPVVPGTNPALQTWNGQTFVVADGSITAPIYLPYLQQNTNPAVFVIGSDPNGKLSFYDPETLGSNFALLSGTQTFTGTNTFTNGIIGNIYGSSFTAYNISGGIFGQIAYQTATDTTGFVPTGNIGQILSVNGSFVPNWINQSDITAGSSAYSTNSGYSTTSGTANIATNVDGGNTGGLLYQSAPAVTADLPIGTANQLLKVNSTGTAPQWQTGITGVTNGTSAASGIVGQILFSSQNVAQSPGSITSITIPAGDWIVYGSITVTYTQSSGVSYTIQGGVNIYSGSIGGSGTYFQYNTHPSNSEAETQSFATPISNVLSSSGQTFYLVFTASGVTGATAIGSISARRMR